MNVPRIGSLLFGLTVGLCIYGYATQPAPTELTEQQRNTITQKITTEILHGQLLYNLPQIRRPAVSFTTSNPLNAAESLCEFTLVSEGSPAWSIRVNERMAAGDYHRFMRETIPHEVAHLLLCQHDRSWWMHSPDWETVVRDMGATPVPLHTYGE
jgi:hypothetical protein